MIIIGVDFHPEFQQIAWVDTASGELQETRLQHREEAENFYRELARRAVPVRVGMEASGHARWFERRMGELRIELWIGDAAEIRTKRVRKQKTDRQDAQLILKLMLKDDFPRIWVPNWENRDLRQLLWHRHRMVQARTRVMNQLQAVALNEGLRCKKEVVAHQTPATGIVPVGSVGQPTTARPAGVAGSIESHHRGTEPGGGAGSGEVSRGTTTGDPSWCGSTYRIGVRADHRRSRALSVWEADCQLSRSGSGRRIQWEPAPARSHHQTGPFDAALLTGGGSAGYGA